MAIWQWNFWLVPKEEVLRIHSVVPDYMDDDWFESVDWWDNVPVEHLVGFFSRMLPEHETPWAKNTKSWGTDEGNRVDLIIEGDKRVSDLSIRFDLREMDLDFLRSLVEFAKRQNFLFFALESKKFVEANLNDLLSEISRSRKIIFLQDPEKFFKETKYLERLNKENKHKGKSLE